LSEVIIEDFKVSQLEELLLFFKKWGSAHPELGEPELLRWQRCQRFVATSEGKIVGHIGQIPHLFSYGKPSGQIGIEHIGWGITLVLDMSDNDIRKQAGRGLLSRCENNPPLLFSGVGIVPEIEEPYRRRGYIVRRDCCRMYARFIKPEGALRYLNKSSLYGPVIKLANLFFRPMGRKDCNKAEKIYEFDKMWNSKWETVLDEQYELYGERNAGFLNYKLSQPNREYHSFIHLDEGYIVFRLAKHRVKNLSLVKVCDLVGSPEVKTDLLRIALDYLYETKALGIVALAAASDEAIYRKAGLYISKPYPMALQKHIKAKMHVSFFDSDLDDLW
jgi:hypothetical protein